MTKNIFKLSLRAVVLVDVIKVSDLENISFWYMNWWVRAPLFEKLLGSMEAMKPMILESLFINTYVLQITLQQHLQTLEDVTKERDDNVNNLDKTKSKLEEATTKLDRQQIGKSFFLCKISPVRDLFMNFESGVIIVIFSYIFLTMGTLVFVW